jgi:hypothetical protein
MRLHPREPKEWDALHRRDQQPSCFASGSTGRMRQPALCRSMEFIGWSLPNFMTPWRPPSCAKKWRRAWKLELIESHNPQWRDLYDELVMSC